MAVDERSRLRLAEVAKRVFGDEAAITLMELLPPVGWADVATKHDLAHLETVMNLQFDAVDRRFESVDLASTRSTGDSMWSMGDSTWWMGDSTRWNSDSGRSTGASTAWTADWIASNPGSTTWRARSGRRPGS